MDRLPSVDEARPGQCPRCGAASRPVGGELSLIGHGLRERQLRGPLEPFGKATVVVVAVRRYRCLGCHAVVTVVPRGVAPWRHYSAMAIAWALALFGLVGESAWQVRGRTSPWAVVAPSAQGDWPTLRRWCRKGRAGLPRRWTLRQVAARRAQEFVAGAPPRSGHRAIEARAFVGAMDMA